MRKLLSSLMAFALMCSIVMVPANAANVTTFDDVPVTHWAYDAISEMAEKGIVAGTGNNKFSPDDKVTVAQFATMMARTFFNDEYEKGSSEDSSDWYGSAMHVALENELLYVVPAYYTYQSINGKDVWRSEDVNAPMSRVHMAAMMFNYLKDHAILATDAEAYQVLSTIPDSKLISSIYGGYTDLMVAYVYGTGCLSGVDTAGTFDGTANMTRAQACVVLSRMMDYVKNNPKNIEYKYDHYSIGNIEHNYSARPTLANGKIITEENILELIMSLKSQYPDGYPCDDNNFKYGKYNDITGCAGFAEMILDTVYGANNRNIWKNIEFGAYTGLSSKEYGSDVVKFIRVGDAIRINGTHSVVVIGVDSDSITVVEGNNGGIVTWGREISKSSLANLYSFSILRHYDGA